MWSSFSCFILFNCIVINTSATTSKKVDKLFDKAWNFTGSRQANIERVLMTLINFDYLSNNFLNMSVMAKRPLLDFVPAITIRKALLMYQRMNNIPTTGVVDAATMAHQLKPRCGNDDRQEQSSSSHRRVPRWVVFKSKDGRVAKFDEKNLTYRILNYPKKLLSRKNVHTIFRQVVDHWAINSGLNFKEVNNPDAKADLKISFHRLKHGDGHRFDGPDGILGHAFFPIGGKLKGVIHFDDDETWTHKTYNGKDFLGVAVHEVGHALGIRHSNAKNSIMNAVFIGYQKHFTLSKDDIEAIQHLYGKPRPNKKKQYGYTAPPVVPPTKKVNFRWTTKPPGVDLCNTAIDTLFALRGNELFIFYKKFHWRMQQVVSGDGFTTYFMQDTPTNMFHFWTILPKSIDHVDAVFETLEQRIMFFSGNKYWYAEYNTVLVGNFPKSGVEISRLNLPNNVKKIDSVFRWGYKTPGKTYGRAFLFAGDSYWEFEELTVFPYGKVSNQDYPRKIADVWHGIPTHVDAIFSRDEEETIFFKGKEYYSFSNRVMKLRKGYPKLINKLSWMGCEKGI